MFDYDDSLLTEALTSSPLVKSVTELPLKSLTELWAKGRDVCRAFKLEIELNGKSVEFYFGIKKSFPLSLPRIFLTQWDLFGIIPHVETDGYICYAQEEGSLLNFEDVAGLAQESLSKAVNVLMDGISGRNHHDFLDEFGAYWDRLKGIKRFISIVSPGEHVKAIHLYKIKDETRYMADDEQSFRKYKKLHPNKTLKHYEAIYIPFPQGTIITPPHPSKFWNISDMRKVVFDNLRTDQKSELLLLMAKPQHEEVILFKLPRASDGQTLFGIEFKGVNHEHPLKEGGRASEISPLAIIRRDKEYLLPRGGSNVALRGKNVLLLGCGAVGGFIANELTRAGISRLTVLDKELLTYENLFRHVLGMRHVSSDKYKVDGIKDDIEGRLPYVEVFPIRSTLEKAVKSGKISISNFDLIISALGNVTVELAFNKYIHSTNSPPVIFTWLEPYGIGGHALLTKLDDSGKGCLKCLYIIEDGELCCRASFAEKGQVFIKNINGCRNVFTPFGSLDAIKTAELATRLAIATLNGEIKTNLIRSWRGDATTFLKNGMKLSPRYLGEKDHFIEYDNYHIIECPICYELKTER
jgi:molybdopterin/thiamine biosynthesis adenylyltransferase